MFSGNKDVDLMILMKLEEKDLINFCQINKYAKKLCLNEDFWRNRLWKYYGKICIEEEQIYKEFYLKLVYYMDKYRYKKDNISFRNASQNGRLEVLKYLISLDREYNIDPSSWDNYAIRWASGEGHLEVVKYLMSIDRVYNIDPSSWDNYAIRLASLKGNLELVKYLMSLDREYNIDPSTQNNFAIKYASYNSHLEVVKYLSSLPKEHRVHL